jgi:FKBP-type peptidyl-prolyl cis-trans isomerase (trigger factor)
MLLLGLVSCGFSYEGDLTSYIALTAPALDALEVALDEAYEVTEEQVEDAIHDLLLDVKTAVSQGKEEQEKTIGDGDVAAIYYTLVSEDGTVWSDGFDVGSTPYLLEVGAGMFPLLEVEKTLVGLLPKEHKVLSVGQVEADSIVYMEYYCDGEAHPLARVDMKEVDALFGEGFASALTGAELGQFTTISVGEREYRVRPRYIGRGEITLEATYPATYTDESRAGKTVTVYLQVQYMVDYDVPAMTDETVREKLKLFETSDTPLSDLRAQVRMELEGSEGRQAAFRRALLDVMEDDAIYLKLPKSRVKDFYGGMKEELEYLYEYSQENLYDWCVETFGQVSMDSFDGFARAMYGYQGDETAKEILMEKAEMQVRHDLLVYALAKAYGVTPTAEDMETGTQKILDTYLAGTDTTEKELLRMWGGREYFEAQYMDAYVFRALSQKVKIVYK